MDRKRKICVLCYSDFLSKIKHEIYIEPCVILNIYIVYILVLKKIRQVRFCIHCSESYQQNNKSTLTQHVTA